MANLKHYNLSNQLDLMILEGALVNSLVDYGDKVVNDAKIAIKEKDKKNAVLGLELIATRITACTRMLDIIDSVNDDEISPEELSEYRKEFASVMPSNYLREKLHEWKQEGQALSEKYTQVFKEHTLNQFERKVQIHDTSNIARSA